MHFSKSSEYIIYNNSLSELFDLHLIYSKSIAFTTYRNLVLLNNVGRDDETLSTYHISVIFSTFWALWNIFETAKVKFWIFQFGPSKVFRTKDFILINVYFIQFEFGKKRVFWVSISCHCVTTFCFLFVCFFKYNVLESMMLRFKMHQCYYVHTFYNCM